MERYSPLFETEESSASRIKKIDDLLNGASKDGCIDEITMGPDKTGHMVADASFYLKKLNDLGWYAKWQKLPVNPDDEDDMYYIKQKQGAEADAFDKRME